MQAQPRQVTRADVRFQAAHNCRHHCASACASSTCVRGHGVQALRKRQSLHCVRRCSFLALERTCCTVSFLYCSHLAFCVMSLRTCTPRRWMRRYRPASESNTRARAWRAPSLIVPPQHAACTHIAARQRPRNASHQTPLRLGGLFTSAATQLYDPAFLHAGAGQCRQGPPSHRV